MPVKKQVDFGIITILDEELDAILSKLSNHKQRQETSERTFFEAQIKNTVNTLNQNIVVLQIHRAGNTNSALSTDWLIKKFNPKYLLLVGIAAGDSKSTKLGDLVVASDIFYYESEKTLSRGAQARPKMIPCSRLLYDRAKALRRQKSWHSNITTKPPSILTSASPNIHWDVIAAGEKVQASGRIFEKLQKLQGKIIALAMEGWGLADAAYSIDNVTNFIEIRGISDFADSAKGDNYRDYAADVAASFAIELIRNSIWSEKSGPNKKLARRTTQPLKALRITPQLNIPEALQASTQDKVVKFLKENFPTRHNIGSVSLNVIWATPGLNGILSPSTFMKQEFSESIAALARSLNPPYFSHFGTLSQPEVTKGLFKLVHQTGGGNTRDQSTTTLLFQESGILSLVTEDLFEQTHKNNHVTATHYIDPDVVKRSLERAFIFANKFWAKILPTSFKEPLLFNIYFHDLQQFSKYGKAPNSTTISYGHKTLPNPLAIFDKLQGVSLSTLKNPSKLLDDICEQIVYEFNFLDK